ncbi:MAG: YbaK/EbsC family protein [Thiobacillaceae bacterium]|nr:YbaK/EbsC family protein [Thiobacillaceae bacterium]MCX7673676.1 YbaK/EbsC family protein [Thiobacillaceae bacterium]MDW8323771.1 YbaK/EbsC family protein [Burkholderiales bacterium]
MTSCNRIERYLQAHHVPYEILTHAHSHTSMATVHSAHIDAARLAKAVLLEGEEGLVAAMLPADRDIRLEQLRQEYGPDLHLADAALIGRVFTDCEPGVVPGLPQAWGVETLWDDTLLAQPDIYLEAGDHERLIHVSTRHLREVSPQMRHCQFSGPVVHH